MSRAAPLTAPGRFLNMETKVKRLPKAELVRLALVYAIQDRDAMAESGAGEYSVKAREIADQLRAYLKQRYGQITSNDALRGKPTVKLHDLMASEPYQRPRNFGEPR